MRPASLLCAAQAAARHGSQSHGSSAATLSASVCQGGRRVVASRVLLSTLATARPQPQARARARAQTQTQTQAQAQQGGGGFVRGERGGAAPAANPIPSPSSFPPSSFFSSSTAAASSSSPTTTPPSPARLPLGQADPAVFDLRLDNLRLIPGSRRQRIRVGRGAGGRRGNKCGKGQKGQKSRTGGVDKGRGFEGGQTPHHLQHRKHGFRNSPFQKRPHGVNIGRLQQLVNDGRLQAGQTVTMKTLKDTGVASQSKMKDGVKLLSGGNLSVPLHFEVTAVSESAKQAVEAAGGSVKRIYYGRVALQYLLRPEKFEFPVRRPLAPRHLRDRFDDWGQDVEGAVEEEETDEEVHDGAGAERE